MEIVVAEHFGSICVTAGAGESLCVLATTALQAGIPVQINFAGVETLATRFLNPAIGCLYATFEEKFLSSMLTLKGLDAIDTQIVETVQRNAIRFSRATSDQQAAIIDVSKHKVK